jgi:vitamin B12 transporter
VQNILKIILLLFLLSKSAFPQIFIEVKDSVSGKSVSNALVFTPGERTFTNEEGKFDLKLFRESDTLKISHLSYLQKKVTYTYALRKGFVLLTKREFKTGEVKIIGEKPLGGKTEIKTDINISSDTKGSILSIGDVLKKQTLLFVKDYGGLQTISFRGMSAENTLVLFNEARVNDLQTGTFDFSILPLNGLDKAEFVKNSTSGFLTSGGIVKLFSGNSKGENNSAFGLAFNSNSTQGYFASVKKAGNKYSFSINANRSFSSNKYAYFFEGKKHFRENAFFSKSFLSGEAEWKNQNAVVKFYSHYSHLLNGLPGFIVSNNLASSKASSESNSFLGVASSDFQLSRHGTLKSVLSFNSQSLTLNDPEGQLFYTDKTQRSHFNDYSVLNKYHHSTKNFGFSFAHYFNYGKVSNLASAIVVNNKQTSAERSENIFLGDFSYRLKLNSILSEIVFSAGVNYSLINERIKERKNYSYLADAISVSLTPQLSKNLALIISLKNNYRHPTFNERFYSGLFGGSNLHGEEYHSFDATIRSAFNYFGKGRLELSYFNIFGSNKIIWVPSRLALQIPRNVAQVKSQGLEFSLSQWLWGKIFYLDFHYAYTQSKNISPRKPGDETYDKQLIYTPRHKAVLTLNANYSIWKISSSFLFVGKRYFTPDNTERNSLNPYFLIDLSLSAEFKILSLKNLITFNIYNALNENYLVIQSYPMPLRTYSINYQMRLK